MFFFSDTTLYYFFSTLAQVLAAVVALVAVLIHFRINALRDFLVGDGKAILMRVEQNVTAYKLKSQYKNRLVDSVRRNDIGGVKRILKHLAQREKDEGITIEDRPTGLQYVYENFLDTEEQINEMVGTSKFAFIWALITALYSVLSILFIDFISGSIYLQMTLISLNLFLLVICCFYIFKGIFLAFKNFTTRFKNVR